MELELQNRIKLDWDDFDMKNRIHNCSNPWQGDAKKILCVCSAGLLRSPTLANFLHSKYKFNTRAVGTSSSFALIPLDIVHLHWADQIHCVNTEETQFTKSAMEQAQIDKPIFNLKISDSYEYMDPDLINILNKIYDKDGNVIVLY